ncbi:MAG: hypothetical protein JAY99_01745 [Candidatus Thiodiazotropha lotti]|nr:hypothetical protein [Candidatus Thiodiazotropha lotti]MCG7998225.1 hypothetical protein [Candidatus Thiodiazotropha lotti]MCW4182854.1 hypothetical protein [Candidatus Thiodiazotropha weberae]MCW4189991.1 hypothetical protein [Candidatus Thiodiazotropha weberae]
MKSFIIFTSGFFTAVILLAVGGYGFMQYTSNMVEEYQSEWIPDFDEQLYKSAVDLAAAKTKYERWVAIGDVGLWNVDNGSLEKAESFAHETLKIAEMYKDDWNYGNAIHKGHLTLGRVALRKGDIEEAKKQLLLAGKTPGSPQLDSFGPNMVLAKELLEKGENDTVLKYLELCEEFWDFHLEKLIKWEEQITRGEKPNFGTNLLY